MRNSWSIVLMTKDYEACRAYFLESMGEFAGFGIGELVNFLPKHLNTICSLFLWETRFSKIWGNSFYKKQRVLRFTYNSFFKNKNQYCSLKMHSVSSAIQEQLLLLLVISPSLGMSEKIKKVTIASSRSFLMVVLIFSASCFFLYNGLKSQKGTLQFFENKIKFEGFTIDFKSNKWLIWSKCLELDKRKRAFPLAL